MNRITLGIKIAKENKETTKQIHFSFFPGFGKVSLAIDTETDTYIILGQM